MKFVEEEIRMANKQMNNSLLVSKNSDDDQLGANLAEFFKGHHICGDNGRLLNLLVQKAGNDSIKELSSHFAEEKLRLREFNELFPCLTACE